MNTSKIQEIHAIVDMSGSMNGKQKDTIGGLMANLDELKSNLEEDYNINYSIKYFDDKEELVLKSTNLTTLTDEQLSNIYGKYKPRGQTALLDALGNSINYFVSKKLLNNGSFDSCIIYVTTDGLENCSKNYNYQTISEMIKNAEENQNIKILYLGANQDAIAEASKYGISVDRAINYSENSDNVAAVYRGAASVANRTRTTGETQFSQVERTASCTQTNRELSPPAIRRGSRMRSE